MLWANEFKTARKLIRIHYIIYDNNCVSRVTMFLFCYCSDIGIGQSQDDSIVGLRQTKHIPPALPVSGTLSSSNPDLLQSHHRILDFNTTPGEYQILIAVNELTFYFADGYRN